MGQGWDKGRREEERHCAGKEQGCSALIRLAGAIRRRLFLHRELGLEFWPLHPELRAFLERWQSLAEKPARTGTPGQRERFALAEGQKREGHVPPVSGEGWADLREEIARCRACSLAADDRIFFQGEAPLKAGLMVVGDCCPRMEGGGEVSGPLFFGPEEDTMLRNMLRAIGLDATEVYVSNVFKCRPEIPPGGEEAGTTPCLGFLRREIALLRPRLICAMGEAAACALLGKREAVSRLRGHFFPYAAADGEKSGINVLVTYHPRFLLKQTDLKKAAWQDLQMLQRRLRAGSE